MSDLAEIVGALTRERARYTDIAEQLSVAIGALERLDGQEPPPELVPADAEAEQQADGGHVCAKCGRTFKTGGALGSHRVRIHQPKVPDLSNGAREKPGRQSHGTAAGYVDGCRCDECRRAEADRKRAWRAAQPAQPKRTATTGAVSIPCPECKKVFGSNQAVGVHRRRAHNIAGAFGGRPIESIEARVPATTAPPEPETASVTRIGDKPRRICAAAGCGVPLSLYNRGDLCATHERKAM